MNFIKSELIVKEDKDLAEKTKAEVKDATDKDMKEVLASEHTKKHDRKRSVRNYRQGS